MTVATLHENPPFPVFVECGAPGNASTTLLEVPVGSRALAPTRTPFVASLSNHGRLMVHQDRLVDILG